MPKGGCWGGRGAGTEGSFKCEVDVLTFSGDAKKVQLVLSCPQNIVQTASWVGCLSLNRLQMDNRSHLCHQYNSGLLGHGHRTSDWWCRLHVVSDVWTHGKLSPLSAKKI